ncbi:MAG: alpha/beta hydrolase family protein, partial [Planctomycetota bacterium]|jgi:dipeptidyl-peptidase-4
VLTWADDLSRPLLIIHGTADDNVYFMHSLKLADALFRAGRDFELLPLSGFTHMMPDPLVTERLYTRIMRFFEENVKRRR